MAAGDVMFGCLRYFACDPTDSTVIGRMLRSPLWGLFVVSAYPNWAVVYDLQYLYLIGISFMKSTFG